MIFQWETEEERLKRFIKISPKRKMEWLREMHESLNKLCSPRTKAIRQKLKEKR